MGKLILVTGGARSGKSTFAEDLASRLGNPITYIATAQVFDEEMRERVRLHQERRGSNWITVEAPLDAADHVAAVTSPVLLFDCLTLFITNHLLREPCGDSNYFEQIPRVVKEVEALAEKMRSCSADVVVVTNEVGLGIVPDNPLSRSFRDVAGLANQKMAQVADEVYFVVSGIPVPIKSLQVTYV